MDANSRSCAETFALARCRPGRHRRFAIAILACVAMVLPSISMAKAADYYSGVFGDGIFTALVEIRRPHFANNSDAHVRSRFRCRGDFCYSPWGDFFEDNTTVPPRGSFVFLQSPRGHQAYVECPFSISMYPGSCSLHGTFTCYANAPGSAPVTGTFYFVDLPCSRSAARYPERAGGQPALPATKPPR